MTAHCQLCGTPYSIRPGDVVPRAATCEKCHADLHACVQCAHYDPKRSNECNEPQADRVEDRRKSNFCEFFKPQTASPSAPGGTMDRAGAARAKLDSLFRKKDGSGG